MLLSSHCQRGKKITVMNNSEIQIQIKSNKINVKLTPDTESYKHLDNLTRTFKLLQMAIYARHTHNRFVLLCWINIKIYKKKKKKNLPTYPPTKMWVGVWGNMHSFNCGLGKSYLLFN